MPLLQSQTLHSGSVQSPHAIRVLLTGFGPFGRYKENPSWLAVKSLHDAVLLAEPPTENIAPSDQDHVMEIPLVSQQIHLTVIQIPVAYEDVLSIVPGLHSRPPILPSASDPSIVLPPPPPNGYDFIFHVGVAGRGPLRIEKLGHKLGYRMMDAKKQYAPIVQVTNQSAREGAGDNSDAEEHPSFDELNAPQRNVHRPGILGNAVLGGVHPRGVPGDVVEGGMTEGVDVPPNRGFGRSYESFSEELSTEIDVPRLIHHLKESGVEQVYSSMDAGHYLCDFVFYCSLAEAKRAAGKQEKDKGTPPKSTPVLFMHCPPVDQPLSTEDVTEAIKKVVLWVCERLA